MRNYIICNKNVNLKNGGRKAPVMSLDEFLNIVCTKLGFDSPDDIADANDIIDALSGTNKCSTKFWNDLSKIDFSLENADVMRMSENITYLYDNIPVIITEKGIPCLCFEGNGDWEPPVVFMLYWDGITFRGYVPIKGNAVNRKMKAAFNNFEEEDNEFIHNEGYPDFDIEKDFEDISYDPDLCLEDFESRLEVK